MDKFDWTKSAVMLLIEKWQKHECLYNKSHVNYYNKHNRYEVLSIIAEEMSEHCPMITIADIKNKIHYLRGQYTRELAKMKASNSGRKRHVPSAFWFNKLLFLDQHIVTQKRNDDTHDDNSFSDSLLDYSKDSYDPLETEETIPKKFKMCNSPYLNEEQQDDSIDYEQQNKAEVVQHTIEVLPNAIEEIPHTSDSIPDVSYFSADSSLNPETNAMNSFKSSKTRDLSQSDTFAEFLKGEFAKITNQDIYDDMMENIMQCLFEAKKLQRQTNRSADLKFN